MATFPTLRPASRVFTPGMPPSTEYRSLRGGRDVVQHGNAVDGQLDLTFLALSMDEMLLLLNHYQEQDGTFSPFQLPTVALDGLDSAEFNLSGYGWQYQDQPAVNDSPENVNRIRYDVSLSLGAVPVRWTVAPGALIRLLYILTAGGATGAAMAPGALLAVGYSLDDGDASAAQFNQASGAELTISHSLSAGAAGP